MGKIMEIISGIGVLIMVYLVMSHASESAKIINTIGSNAVNGIQVLQGRTKLITNS